MRIGLDIHGVIDAKPEFFAILSNLLIENGHEVHVLTGSIETEEIHEELRGFGIRWTHFFSIADYNQKIGTKVTFDEDGHPWMDKTSWNRSKGDYCRIHQIDLCIDDTIGYGDYFTTPFSRFFSKHVSKSVQEIKADSDWTPDAEKMLQIEEVLKGNQDG